MDLKDHDELINASKTKTIALCANVPLPCASHRPARQPANDHEGKTPETDDANECDANPSHSSRLEDAKVLEKKGQLDQRALRKIDAVLDIEGLERLAFTKTSSGRLPYLQIHLKLIHSDVEHVSTQSMYNGCMFLVSVTQIQITTYTGRQMSFQRYQLSVAMNQLSSFETVLKVQHTAESSTKKSSRPGSRTTLTLTQSRKSTAIHDKIYSER